MSQGSLSSSLARLNGLFAVVKPAGITSANVVDRLKTVLLRDIGYREEHGEQLLHGECRESIEAGEKGGSPNCAMYKTGWTNKKCYKLPKIGHGGTLDMHATGVLVIGIGRGTKQLASYLQGGKTYVAHGCLGKATDTMDASGEVTESSEFGHISECDFKGALNNFVGNIMQAPPLYSALKVQGERMSDLVKRGVEVAPKPERPVQVYSLRCLTFNPPDFTFEVNCGGGFYVRKLIHDLGKSLGSCAHMMALCRTKQGYFMLDKHALPEDRWTLQDILQAVEEFQGDVGR
ncbi:pseudouridylate synthase TRUB1-like isoform X2 [Diadema setosum]|uniref:pseudouridylate synthase TRUB1-like isoform X2 n=1 Tax=Diadema setosum TaxID=31175 RepID=UPI003B3B5294